MPLPTTRKGGIPMDAAQVMRATGLQPVRKRRATAVKPVQAPVIASGTIEPEALKSLPAPLSAHDSTESAAMGNPMAEQLAATVAALLDRVAVLESRETVKAALIRAAANDDTTARSPRVARERIVRRYLAMRAERARLREERDAAERKLWSVQCQLQGATRRAERMARVATGQRRDVRRAVDDLRGARAEARAVQRKLDMARGEIAARAPSRPAPPPTDTIMAVAFAAARN